MQPPRARVYFVYICRGAKCARVFCICTRCSPKGGETFSWTAYIQVRSLRGGWEKQNVKTWTVGQESSIETFLKKLCILYLYIRARGEREEKFKCLVVFFFSPSFYNLFLRQKFTRECTLEFFPM